MKKITAAEYFDTSVRTIEQMMAAGQIEPVRLGGQVRIPRAELDRIRSELPRGGGAKPSAIGARSW